MKEVLKNLFKKLGYRIVNLNSIERDPFKDQVRLISNNPTAIFDVGACTGEVSIHYNNLFSNSIIYCFEPYLPSFHILKEKTSSRKNIKCFNLALSNTSGEQNFHVNKFYATNSILATHADSAKNWNEEALFTLEEIKISSITLDDFVILHEIDKIDILKLDTQGTEFQIIEGASQSIRENKISLIYMEIILMPTYQEQKNLDEILLLLRNMGFSLYNFYNYSYTNAGELRQVDAIFTRK